VGEQILRRASPERRSCAAGSARPSCRRSASRGAGRDVGGYRVLAALRPQGGGTASGLVPSSRRGPRCASSVSRRRPGRHLVLTGHGARCTWRRTLDAAPRTLDGGQSPRPYCPRMGVPHQLTLGDRRDGGARGRGPRTRPRACGCARTHHRGGASPRGQDWSASLALEVDQVRRAHAQPTAAARQTAGGASARSQKAGRRWTAQG